MIQSCLSRELDFQKDLICEQKSFAIVLPEQQVVAECEQVDDYSDDSKYF